MLKKRGQAAVEYLLVSSLLMLVILPTLYVFYAYSQVSKEEINQGQLNKVGNDLVDVAEQIYYLGYPSKIAIESTMPEGVVGIEIWENNEVVFFLKDGSEVAFKSNVNLTTNQHCIGNCYGNFSRKMVSPGVKKIIIEAREDHVFIREAGDNQTDQADIEENVVYCDNDNDDFFSEEESISCAGWIPSSNDKGDDCNDNDNKICPDDDECPEICDGKDNNCDRGIDEGFTNETCNHICDKNGYEWLDTFCCGNDIGEANPYQETEKNCSDENDNDCNGFTDCEDSNCDGKICDENTNDVCIGGICTSSEICTDGVDNDGDTLIDCDDIEGCPIGTICSEDGKVCQENVYGGRECIFSVYSIHTPGDLCVDEDQDGYGVCPDCGVSNGCDYNDNDCCDDDPLVRPGAGYQYVISACGTWDYNCSEEIEKFGEDTLNSLELTGCTTTVPSGHGGWIEPSPHECGEKYTQRLCVNYANEDCTGEIHAFYYQPCYDAPTNCGDKYGICFTPKSWRVIEQEAHQWCR
jgi:hypothetical protein